MSEYRILDLLGIDHETMVWHDIALCRRIATPEIFFDEYEQDPETAKAVDLMCLNCPVIRKCRVDAVSGQETGCWAGVYVVNGDVDITRNLHKTPEIWERLEEVHGPLLGTDKVKG